MSEILLSAVVNCKTERELTQVADITKATRVSKESVELAVKNAKKEGFAVGKRVIMYDDPEVGEIVRFNTATVGFESGDRYPIVVKFKRGTFPFNTDALTLIGG